MNDQGLRIGDAEREQAAAGLAEHYAQGRLTAEEHSERLDRIWEARTRGELVPLFSDLPGHATAHATPRGAHPSLPGRSLGSQGWVAPFRRGLPTPFLVGFVALVVLTVVTHLPLVLVGLLAWFFVVPRHRRRHPSRGW